jgi:hypothetical protein
MVRGCRQEVYQQPKSARKFTRVICTANRPAGRLPAPINANNRKQWLPIGIFGRVSRMRIVWRQFLLPVVIRVHSRLFAVDLNYVRIEEKIIGLTRGASIRMGGA